MPHPHVPLHPDGTGESWAGDTVQLAIRARDAAEKAGTLTWSHLLTVSVATALAATNATELNKQLVDLSRVVSEWRRDLAYRRGDVRCLSICCNPDATGDHNSRLALN